MSEPFLAEVRIVGFNFAPRGWAFCDGQILPINQNQSLYSLLGTTYGGDGQTSFALPDMRGRTPIHEGTGPGGAAHQLGQKAGEEGHTLSAAELPEHGHGAQGTSETPAGVVQAGNLLAPTGGGRRPIAPYGPATNLTPLAAGSIGNAGSGQAHENMQPWLALNFCIALQGVFPSQN